MTNQGNPKITKVIEQVCVQFESEWRAGRRPAIETCLIAVPPVEQAALFRELLELEVECRLRSGERPPVEEYQKRFPVHCDVISAVFFKPAPAVPTRQSEIDPAAMQLTLTVIDGPDKGQVFTFAEHDVFLAGRSKQTGLRLKDPYCGRYHFMIEVNPPLCRLTDMGSRNCTSVNEQDIKSTSVDLRDGDVIRAGHTALQVAISKTEPADEGEISDALTMYLPGTNNVEDPESTQPTLPAPPDTGQARPKFTYPDQPKTPFQAGAGSCGDDAGLPGYEFLAEQGQGGMGKVYRAKRFADGVTVAIKAITTDAAANHKQLQRFMREAIILCQLRHPHIVAFNELLQVRGRPFIVMEYVEGRDVASILKQRNEPLAVRTAVRMMLQVLSALEYAHAMGFVHRDIKPHNVLFGEREGGKTVKLADFGLARVYQESRLSGLTLNGEWGGTIAYIAPEQIKQFRQVKPAADQYSAAATLYSMLSNQCIFDLSGKFHDVVSKILLAQPIPLLTRNSQVPSELANIIHRALAKQPEDRFPSIKAFRRALQPFAQ